MTALHEQLIQVKGESENTRKEIAQNRSKVEQQNHENKIRIRGFNEEIEKIKLQVSKVEKMPENEEQKSDIEVIMSIDGTKWSLKNVLKKIMKQNF